MIQQTNPFADPSSARDTARAFRGRLATGVTLWTAMGERGPAGLTVSSVLVANGTPPRLLALLDPLASLSDAWSFSKRAAVTVLARGQRQLAEVFAGTRPAPGGAFRAADFVETKWGPVPSGSPTWAGVSLESSTELGWSLLATGVLEHVEFASAEEPLLHYRGDYPRLEP